MGVSTIVPSPSGVGILSRANGQVASKAQVDMQSIAETGVKLQELAAEMKNIFPERDGLIEQIIFSLVTREHVLIWGPYGTGKSDLTSTLLNQIDGGTQFKIGLNKFMTESHLFGPPNPVKLREEGIYEYSKEGTVLEAHYVVLDELFDASPALLRTLLGVLNEKMFKRGRDIKNADLLSAFATTNGDPAKEIRMRSELGAVIDRFLFQTKVDYLGDTSDSPNRRRMYQKYLQGQKPTVQLTLEEIIEFSSVVTDVNQITDPYFIEVYDQVVQAYRQEIALCNENISDRRACKLLQLVEANALLHGRFEVILEDILAIKWGLCFGNDSGRHETFHGIAEPILEDAARSWTQSVDEMQAKLLQNFEEKFRELELKPATDNDSRINLYRDLTDLMNNVDAIQPALGVNRDRKDWLIQELNEMRDEVHTKLLG